jgi:predicted ATPase
LWRPADAAAGRAGRDARLGARRLTGDRYVATHSPILLATPDARIYELDGGGVAPCGYDDLEAVRLTRGFLDAPERFIRAALDET